MRSLQAEKGNVCWQDEPAGAGSWATDHFRGRALDDCVRDVDRIFANCVTYYGPGGSGRALHGDADADAYVELARVFAEFGAGRG